ncbi:MAG: hypothetical protein WDA75_15280 [Candidatus Latescibacterota bacterium]
MVSAPAAGRDELPPAPVADISAVDRPDDEGGCISVSWSLSPDDRTVFVALPPAGYMPTAEPGAVTRQPLVWGYRIYRARTGGAMQLVSQVGPGVFWYLDQELEDGVPYSYEIRPFDSAHETPAAILPGTAADQARIARPMDNRAGPLDELGQPVLGWFNPDDDTVGFDDFFLFADHFGRVEGEAAFDARFDLSTDGRVDFADFFIFADYFAARVANYGELTTGDLGE